MPSTCERVLSVGGPAGGLTRRGALLAGAALILAAAPGQAVENAAVPVERLHAGLLQAASDGSTVAQRRRMLDPVVTDTFDFTTMSRVAVGRDWAGFGEEQRQDLSEQFAAFAAANYASNFDKADGLVFETLGVRPDDGERVWVDTRLIRPNGDPVRFDYLVHPTADGPRIINVVVDGTLNELGRRRGEFRSLLNRGGLPLLLDTLEARTEAGG